VGGDRKGGGILIFAGRARREMLPHSRKQRLQCRRKKSDVKAVEGPTRTRAPVGEEKGGNTSKGSQGWYVEERAEVARVSERI